MGREFKCRSSSPCRREERDTKREYGNSLRHNALKPFSSQEGLTKSCQIELSASTPESSFREMMVRERRLYSVPHGNFLGVPQSCVLPPTCHLEENKKDKKPKMFSSHTDLSCLEVDQGWVNMNKQNISRPKSTSGLDRIWVLPDAGQKCKHGILKSVKSVIKNLGLSPRSSPRHSPASSRSASPSNSPSLSTPYGSPFSPTVEWPM